MGSCRLGWPGDPTAQTPTIVASIWRFWRTIYLYKLPGFQKRFRVALDWTLDMLFSKDAIQFHTPYVPAMDRPETSSTEPESRAPRVA